jgi:hypothetical protein
MTVGIKPACAGSIAFSTSRVKKTRQKNWEACPGLARKGRLLMELSAILIAAALSLTMLVAVADLP